MNRDEIAAIYDHAAESYDARSAVDARSRARTARLDELQLAAARGARRVLEIGCGTGRLLAQVAAATRIGVDVSGEMLRRAAGRGLEVARADGHALPFLDGSFDAVLAGKGVFRYLDPARSFGEAARVLAPGGRLAVHQYGNRTWSPRGRARPEPGLFELAELDDLLEPARDAGLIPEQVRLFRSIRVRPYLLEIPGWLDRRLPVQLWSHCVAIFVRSP